MGQFLPKKRKEDVELDGILSILQPSNVSVVVFSFDKGMKELIYKVCRGYAIEQHRFFHSVNSTHKVFKVIYESDVASSDYYVESEDYENNMIDG